MRCIYPDGDGKRIAHRAAVDYGPYFTLSPGQCGASPMHTVYYSLGRAVNYDGWKRISDLDEILHVRSDFSGLTRRVGRQKGADPDSDDWAFRKRLCGGPLLINVASSGRVRTAERGITHGTSPALP